MNIYMASFKLLVSSPKLKKIKKNSPDREQRMAAYTILLQRKGRSKA